MGLVLNQNGEYASPKKREFKELDTSNRWIAPRETKYIPSLKTTGKISLDKKEPLVYTGTLVKGIATMHKSNAVPVISQEHAEDISKMRRG
jgi:hypothetical protein